jgi:CheY-like chemotaxis protein
MARAVLLVACMHSRAHTPDALPRVLVVEDDATLRAQIARSVRELGWQATELADGRELLVLLDEQTVADGSTILVTDMRMPHVDGIELLAELSSRACRLPTIMVTGFADEPTRQMARALGVSILFVKPFDVDDLCTALQFLRAGKRLRHTL